MKDTLKVLVRLRPSTSPHTTLTMSSPTTLSLDTSKALLNCSYDSVLGPGADRSDVYEQVKRSVECVSDGINGCVFAYGQTGAGKTHTMLGQGGRGGVVEDAVASLFGR